MPELLGEWVGDELAQLSDINSGFIMQSTLPGSRVMDAATRLAQRFERPGESPLLLHAAVLEFLGCQFEGMRRNNTPDAVPPRERRRLLAARERLLADLSAPPTIATLATASGLNQLKLKRGFKLLFGTSIYALFQRQRMERARELLSQYSVTETALLLGYSNMSHFSATFRRQFGLLPSEVRRNVLVPAPYPVPASGTNTGFACCR